MNLPNLTSYNLTELWNSKSLLPLVSLFNPFSIIGCHTLFQGLFPNAKCQHLDSQAISYYWQSPNNFIFISRIPGNIYCNYLTASNKRSAMKKLFAPAALRAKMHQAIYLAWLAGKSQNTFSCPFGQQVWNTECQKVLKRRVFRTLVTRQGKWNDSPIIIEP